MRTTTIKKSKINGKKKVLSQQDKQEFKKYLEEIEDPNYQGGSQHLPDNATTSEKTKYEICEKVVKYKRSKRITTEKLAQQIGLSKAETEDILYCRIDYLTLDRLLSYIDKLFAPSQVKIVFEEENKRKRNLFYA